MTDANLVLGRLLPKYFPKIFGPGEDEPLDAAASAKAFEVLMKESKDAGMPALVEEVALGFIKVANEAMCRPIREMTQMKGFDVSNHILSCFGGAGGQHACAIARVLGKHLSAKLCAICAVSFTASCRDFLGAYSCALWHIISLWYQSRGHSRRTPGTKRAHISTRRNCKPRCGDGDRTASKAAWI